MICSADMDKTQFGEDTDSIDRHFGINWLGQFYACNLLYPLLRNTSQKADTLAPRIVWESSQMHYNAPSVVHFASLDEINNSGLSSAELYGRSKLPSSWASSTAWSSVSFSPTRTTSTPSRCTLAL